ncbi:unnamed protein product [Lathyrus oleraceus]|uniref:Uncharacterized protein n=2 Tax=Pisum sativum TaxID=3888 RepID=A0A9D4XUI9_PEA|nr:protein NRT1/ PTR FAMILY 5.2-like [Pisum sativum]KAI5426364.1 hypothetical protein KIW84_031968 [Pisum sativum]
MAVVEEKGQEKYTEDGTVDLQGRPVLRSKSGRWKACSFIVVYEIFERMAYFGIATNLVVYLTNKLHEGTVESSNSVSNWSGSVWLMPIAGAYVADAYLGRYWTFVISSCIYLMGMCLLTLAVSLPSLRPPQCAQGILDQDCPKASPLQKGIFFLALYIISIGTGGTKPNISTLGADQFDEFDTKERFYKLSFFNWWVSSIMIGVLFSSTFLVYIQDNVGWAFGYGLPTIGLAISITIFLVGTPFYRHRLPSGSPMTKMLQVFVAAMRKWKTLVPKDPNELHELSIEEYACSYKNKIDHTFFLRILDRAAVKTGETSSWRLCTVTQVEETKQMIKMIPILILTIIPNTMLGQSFTLFIKQGITLDRRMGHNFEIPPSSLVTFIVVFMLISIVAYDRVFVPMIRRYTKNPRGITILQRLGIGLMLHVIMMIISCLVERKRLRVARENNLLGLHDKLPLSIFILLPQYALTGIAESFVENSKMDFFYDQAPQSMKSLGTSYTTTSLGLGNFLSTFLLSVVADITRKEGSKGWILDNLNISRLDYYYAFLVALSVLNFLCFLVVSKLYVYNVDVRQNKSCLEMNPADSSLDKSRISQSSRR